MNNRTLMRHSKDPTFPSRRHLRNTGGTIEEQKESYGNP